MALVRLQLLPERSELVVGAQHFARIFLQNSINLGMRTIICPDIAAALGDEIEVTSEKVVIKTMGKSFDIVPLPKVRQAIIDAGGLIALRANAYYSRAKRIFSTWITRFKIAGLHGFRALDA